MPIEAGIRVGSYEILSLLGTGGMGEVYRARDMKLSREVALKVLPEAMAQDPQRMAGEFQASSPKVLFKQPLALRNLRNSYAVSPDGQRFLMLVPASDAGQSPITVVSNWQAMVKTSDSK